jgi:hypothetical protein
MKTTRTSPLSLIVLALLAPAAAQGQVTPDPSLWTPATVTNPSGARPVPVVQYDPATGILSVNTLGVNGASDTIKPTTIGGDDVGMISLLVTSQPATGTLLSGIVGDMEWSGQHFNAKQQVFGVPAADQFLAPGTTDVFQYPAGLTPADFGPVEMGINFSLADPGAVLFGSVQFAGSNCPADLDTSGYVGVDDLLAVLAAWGPYEPCPPFAPADIDRDCDVGVNDLLAVLAAWGPCP